MAFEPNQQNEINEITRGKKRDKNSIPGFSAILVMGSYTVLWVASVMTPLLFIYLTYNGLWMQLFVFGIFVSFCYIPFKTPGSKVLRNFYAKNVTRYFVDWSLNFEEISHAESSTKNADVTSCLKEVQNLKQKTKNDKPILYGIHPHGIFCMGWGSIFVQPEFDGVNFCYSGALMASPIFRLFTKILGKPTDVSKSTMQKLMKTNQSLALIPGGFEEASLHCYDQDRVFLNRRYGFVKLALQHGYTLKAVFAFGERKTFWNAKGFYKFRFLLNSYGLPAILPFGWKFFPLLPIPEHNLDIWVSRELILPKIDAPTRKEVKLWHTKYVDMLKDMHMRRKGKDDKDLEIW